MPDTIPDHERAHGADLDADANPDDDADDERTVNGRANRANGVADTVHGIGELPGQHEFVVE